MVAPEPGATSTLAAWHSKWRNLVPGWLRFFIYFSSSVFILFTIIWLGRVSIIESLVPRISTNFGWQTNLQINELGFNRLIINQFKASSINAENSGEDTSTSLEIENIQLTYNFWELMAGQIKNLSVESVKLTLPEKSADKTPSNDKIAANQGGLNTEKELAIPNIKQTLNQLPFVAIQLPDLQISKGGKTYDLGIEVSNDPEIGVVLLKGLATFDEFPPTLIYFEYDKDQLIEFFINQYNDLLLDSSFTLSQTFSNDQLQSQTIDWTAQFKSAALNTLLTQLAKELSTLTTEQLQKLEFGLSDINLSGSVTLPDRLNLKSKIGLKTEIAIDGQSYIGLNSDLPSSKKSNQNELNSNITTQLDLSIKSNEQLLTTTSKVHSTGYFKNRQIGFDFSNDLSIEATTNLTSKSTKATLDSSLNLKQLKLESGQSLKSLTLNLSASSKLEKGENEESEESKGIKVNENKEQFDISINPNIKLIAEDLLLDPTSSTQRIEINFPFNVVTTINKTQDDVQAFLQFTSAVNSLTVKGVQHPNWQISDLTGAFNSNFQAQLKTNIQDLTTVNKFQSSALEFKLDGLAIKPGMESEFAKNNLVSFSSIDLQLLPIDFQFSSALQSDSNQAQQSTQQLVGPVELPTISTAIKISDFWGVWDDKLLPKTTLAFDNKINPNSKSISTEGYLDLNKQLRFNLEGTGNQAAKSLAITATLNQDIAQGTNKVLSDLGLYDAPRLIAGKTDLKQVLNINLDPFVFSTTGYLKINDLYAKTNSWELDNQSLDLNWQGDLNRFTGQGQFGFENFNSGVGISNLTANSEFQLDLSTQRMLVDINDVKLNVLGGSVKAPIVKFDSTQETNAFGIIVEGVEMNEILKMQQIPGVYGTGYLDGLIPVVLTSKGIEIPAGNLQARKPGGLIRLTDQQTAQALAESDPSGQMGVLTEVLKNFNYQELLTSLDMTDNGDLRLTAAFKGQNPDYLDGREVHLNTNINFNIYPLLETLQFTSGINQKFENFYQEQ